MKTRTIQTKDGPREDGYTGLRDKNGVEIYENDIIIVNSLYYPGAFLVRFDYQWTRYEIFCAPCYRAPLYSITEAKIEQTGRDVISSYYSLVGDNIQVIGNIHESPTLIEEKNKEFDAARHKRDSETLNKVKNELREYNQRSWWHRSRNPFIINHI